MTTVFQHLDDPVPLFPASSAQRQADMDRGAELRRRRRAVTVATSLGAAVLTAAAVGFSTWSSGLTHDGADEPAAPPAQSSPLTTLGGPANSADTAVGACEDPVGDSSGELDLTLVALDRPAYPFIHFTWEGSTLPSEGTVEALFRATSADGLRSRELVVVVVDGAVDSQSVLDPATGEREFLDPDALTDTIGADGELARAVDVGREGLAATWPAAPFMALGDAWTWTASITVDGTVFDVCDGSAP